jgi:ferritin
MFSQRLKLKLDSAQLFSQIHTFCCKAGLALLHKWVKETSRQNNVEAMFSEFSHEIAAGFRYSNVQDLVLAV